MWLIDVYVLLLGLLFGSFFNVAAIRFLQGESVVYPPSRCYSCKHRLGPGELIPLFSFLLLRGKCKHCRQKISPLYPFGELITALSFYFVYQEIGLRMELVVGLLLASLLVIAVITDLRSKLILDVFTFPAMLLFLVLRIWVGQEPWWFYVAGGLSGFMLLLVISVLSKGGMGGGDVKLFGAIGVALGPWLTLFSLGLASCCGALIGMILMASGKVKRKQPIPFAPFIWLGTMVAYLYGTSLWQWYLNLW